jgi:hypothetical protein
MLIALAPRTQDFEERLWEKIDKRGPNDCWPWTGCHNRYGLIHGWREKNILAHRAVFALTHTINDTMVVRHSCDNPLCCNPNHLLAGTQQDNMHDMMERGRGSKPPLISKLSEQQVRAILGDHRLHRVIAAEYGISKHTVGAIKAGGRWKHGRWKHIRA